MVHLQNKMFQLYGKIWAFMKMFLVHLWNMVYIMFIFCLQYMFMIDIWNKNYAMFKFPIQIFCFYFEIWSFSFS
jgi:hypothetical protein